MLWALLSIVSGTVWGIINLISKKKLENTSSLNFITIFSIVAWLFYLPFFIYFLLDSSFVASPLAWIAMLVAGAANITGFLAMYTAIDLGQVSEVVPISKSTPVFTAIVAGLLLGERLLPVNYIGILVVVAGSFLILVNPLNLARSYSGKAKKPVLLGVLSALSWAVASTMNRFATQQIDPKIYTFLIYTLMVTGFLGYRFVKNRPVSDLGKEFNSARKIYAVVGAMAVIGSLAIMYSFSLAPASKVIPLKQVQIFISVIGGGEFFQEESIGRKLLGAVLLTTGIALVVL